MTKTEMEFWCAAHGFKFEAAPGEIEIIHDGPLLEKDRDAIGDLRRSRLPMGVILKVRTT